MSSSSATGAGVGLLRSLLGIGRLRYVVVGLALGVLLLATVEVRTAYVRDAVLEYVYGSAPHRVPCDKWPTLEKARRILHQRSDVVGRIASVNPGFVTLRLDSRRCAGTGRAEVVIEYATRSDREAIRAIVGDKKYFLGIPYLMRNI